MYYASIGVLAIIILLIINFDALRKPRYGEYANAHFQYRSFLFSVLAYYITDVLWGLLYREETLFFCYIDTVLYFAAMALSIFFWIRYVIKYIKEQNKFFTLLTYIGYLFLIFSVIIIVMNFFTPVLFWFDTEGVYHPGTARIQTLSVQIILFFIISLYAIAATLRTNGKKKKMYRSIWGSSFTMAVFIILQRIFVFLPFYSIGFIIITCLIHTFVLENQKEARREELEKLLQIEEIQEAELGSARKMAFTDPLTGVKNKNAYIEDVSGIEKRIEDEILKDFAAVVFDVNDLKAVNDTKGHEEGDNFIKSAAKIICHAFKHSPVYRIGGDEFVAFLMGDDFHNRHELVEDFNKTIEMNKANGGVIIACGCEEYHQGQDNSFLRVFERADRKMYERKKQLKGI